MRHFQSLQPAFKQPSPGKHSARAHKHSQCHGIAKPESCCREAIRNRQQRHHSYRCTLCSSSVVILELRFLTAVLEILCPSKPEFLDPSAECPLHLQGTSLHLPENLIPNRKIKNLARAFPCLNARENRKPTIPMHSKCVQNRTSKL